MLTLLLLAVEDAQFASDSNEFSVFKVLFEVSSAFGNVGLSLGSSTFTYVSFASVLSSSSKLILCLIMIMGRHRAIPTSLDSAVILSLANDDEDEDDHEVHVAEGDQLMEMPELQSNGPGRSPAFDPTHSKGNFPGKQLARHGSIG